MPTTKSNRASWRETWTIAGVVAACCLVTAFTIAIVGWVVSLQQRDAVLPALVPGASTPTLAPPPQGLLPQSPHYTAD